MAGGQTCAKYRRCLTFIPPGPEPWRVLVESQNNWILRLDAPDHGRIRSLVSASFTPRMVQTLAPDIEAIAAELLADIEDEMEVVSQLAFPLPVIVIARLLGVPGEDRMLFKAWSDAAGRPPQRAHPCAQPRYEAE